MLEQLTQQYKNLSSTLRSRDKALLERDIVREAHQAKAIPAEVKATRWLSLHLLESQYNVLGRSCLLTTDVPELWRRVDEGMPYSIATRVVRRAKEISKAEVLSIQEGVHRALQELEDPRRFHVYRTKRGKTSYRRNRTIADSEPTPTEDSVSTSATTYHCAWDQIQGVLQELLHAQLPNSSVAEREHTAAEYMGQMRAVYEAFQRDARKQRSRAQRGARTQGVSKYALKQALAELGVPASFPVDMNTVGRRYRVLACRFHPDSNQGSRHMEQLLAKYHSVNAAYDLVKQYNRENRDGKVNS
jgi:DnaJ-domain-containing protein 1